MSIILFNKEGRVLIYLYAKHSSHQLIIAENLYIK